MALLENDPIDWELDTVTHDLVITDDIQWTSGVPGVAQGVKIAVSYIKGELFYDLDEGVPYIEREGVDPSTVLLGSKFSVERARAAMRPAILKVPGVLDIVSLDPTFDTSTRTLTVRF